MTTTVEKKIEVETARAHLSAQLMEYNTTHLKRAQLKHWTRGKDHTPFADEIIVEDENKKTRVIFGVEYDDQGYIGAVYETDTKGKRTNLPFANTVQKDNSQMAKRIETIKKREAKTQAKAEEKAPAKTTAKRVVRKASPVIQTERLG